jgi:hypothetical protein
VHLIRRLAAERFVGAILVVPIDGEFYFSFEFSLIFGNYGQPQDSLQRSVESLHDGDATAFTNRSKSRQDVLGFAPDVLEVIAFELGALVDNQMFGLHMFSRHDAIHGRSHFLGGWPALENIVMRTIPMTLSTALRTKECQLFGRGKDSTSC